MSKTVSRHATKFEEVHFDVQELWKDFFWACGKVIFGRPNKFMDVERCFGRPTWMPNEVFWKSNKVLNIEHDFLDIQKMLLSVEGTLDAQWDASFCCER